ncbi:MAG: hypothetical protein IH985_05570, partial [Planctomycetes bacterium]|nr:hypothetical protein [Planctomycetota bacterium]
MRASDQPPGDRRGVVLELAGRLGRCGVLVANLPIRRFGALYPVLGDW